MIPAFLADIELRKMKDNGEENRIGATAFVVHGYDIQEDINEEEVLQSKGGGGPTPPSAMEEARAQQSLDESRARNEEASRIAAEQRETVARTGREAKASTQQGQTYDNAYGQFGDFSAGYNAGDLDRYGVKSAYTNALDNTRAGWGSEDANTYINAQNKFDDAIGQGTKTRRMGLNQGWQDIYGQNYANNAFTDSMDDNLINSIMGQRGEDAMAQITASRDRGQLNDGGYNRALSEYENQQKVARSDLDKIGQGILSGYRGQADAYNTKQLDTIGGLGFNDRFTNEGALSGLDMLVSRLGGQLEGDFYGAVQGQNFFDPNSAITKAGSLQGYYNPTSAPASAGTNPTASNKLGTVGYDDKRTASTNGVF